MADPNNPSPWSIEYVTALYLLIVAMAGSIVKLLHAMIKRGKRIANQENREKLLEQQVSNIQSRLDGLELDIKIYREDQSKKLDKIIDNQTKLSNDISFIRGKMSKRDKSESS